LRVLTDRTKHLEEENDELRKRMGALARRNKRKGQVLHSETNSSTTSSRTYRNRLTTKTKTIPIQCNNLTQSEDNTMKKECDRDNRVDKHLCNDDDDVDRFEYEMNSEYQNNKTNEMIQQQWADQKEDDSDNNDLTRTEYALHRVLKMVSNKLEKKLTNLPGNHSKLRYHTIKCITTIPIIITNRHDYIFTVSNSFISLYMVYMYV